MLSTCCLSLRSFPGKLKTHFVRPFRVKKAVRNNAVELKLLTTMRVHPVFNVSLLHKFQGKSKPPGPIIVDGEAEYKVKKIVRHRGNSKHHLVIWLGYDESKDFKMKADELMNAPLVL